MYLKAEWSYQFTSTMTEYKVLPNRVRETEGLLVLRALNQKRFLLRSPSDPGSSTSYCLIDDLIQKRFSSSLKLV